jgi:hypothetical protein
MTDVTDTTDVTDRAEPEETTSRRGLLIGLALGAPVIAYGIGGALVDSADTQPRELTTWIVGAALVDDLVIIPVALAAAWLARRLAPQATWPAIRAGLITAAILTAVGWPMVQGYGEDPHNPSLLNRNYAAGLLGAIAVIAVITATWAFIARRRETHSRP